MAVSAIPTASTNARNTDFAVIVPAQIRLDAGSPAHNHPLEGPPAIIEALRKGVQLGFASLPEQWDVLGYLHLSASVLSQKLADKVFPFRVAVPQPRQGSRKAG